MQRVLASLVVDETDESFEASKRDGPQKWIYCERNSEQRKILLSTDVNLYWSSVNTQVAVPWVYTNLILAELLSTTNNKRSNLVPVWSSFLTQIYVVRTKDVKLRYSVSKPVNVVRRVRWLLQGVSEMKILILSWKAAQKSLYHRVRSSFVARGCILARLIDHRHNSRTSNINKQKDSRSSSSTIGRGCLALRIHAMGKKVVWTCLTSNSSKRLYLMEKVPHSTMLTVQRWRTEIFCDTMHFWFQIEGIGPKRCYMNNESWSNRWICRIHHCFPSYHNPTMPFSHLPK